MKHIRLIATLAIGILILVGAAGLMMRTSSGLAAVAERNASQAADKIGAELLAKFQADGQADFIVRFTEQVDLAPAFSMGWEERGVYVVNALTDAAGRSQATAKSLLEARGLSYRTFIAGNELYVWNGNLEAASELASLPDVDHIRETRVFYIDPVETTNKQLRDIRWAGDLLSMNAEQTASPDALAWGIQYTNADQFWTAFGIQGDNILVANIDTGVQWNHPALDQAYRCGADPSDPACWEDPSNICGGSACDNNGHGTHTMGTMVGDDDPSLTWQAGMAPNSQWIACKGCESNSCSDFALNTCADWILQPDGDPANRPHIVNNSWGGGGGDPWYMVKVNAWRAAGTFPAFSAGNAGSACNTLGSPGDYQESFSSAAVDSGGNVASFSSRGPSAYGHDPYTKPNISAPGVSVCSSVPTNAWSCGYSGTSMASPHSAGAVALLWSCNPGLIGQMDLTFQALQNTAAATPAGNCGAPPDGEGNYTYGYGYLDVLAAGTIYCGDIFTGWLDGYVTNVDTGDPIEGASVIAVPAVLEDNNIQATTDPFGYYTMTLVVGTYDVTASKNGYTSQTVSGIEIITDTVTSQDFEISFLGAWMPGPSMCFDFTRFDAEYFPATEMVYILGGRSGASTLGDIYEYDPVTESCADTGANMPNPISNYTVNLINDGSTDLLCTFGGRTAGGTQTLNVQCYDPIANTASIVTDLPAAYTGYVPGAQVVYNNQVYVFGGFNPGGPPYELARTDRYDPVANSFTQLGNLSLARSYLMADIVDGQIYAFGGTVFDGANLISQTRAEVMADPEGAGTWDNASVADLPSASAEGRAYGFDSNLTWGLPGQIVIAGGGEWPGETAEALVYDVASDSYDVSFPDLLNARRDHAGVTVPICTDDPSDALPAMWVFGGRQGVDDPPYMPAEYFPLLCGLDVPNIGIEPLQLEAGLFPNQTTSTVITIENNGYVPLDWSLHEMSPTVRLSGQIAPLSTEPRGREINLEIVGAPGGSVQAGPWEPAGTIELVLDDGSVETAIGIGGTWEFIYLNRFTPDGADFPFYIEEVSVYFPSFGAVQVGDEMILALYENTSGNPDPAVDSNYLASFPVTVQELNTWNSYMLPTPIYYFGPGDVLVGVVALETPGTSYWPAALDTTASQQRSWAGWWLDSPPPDPPLLPPDDTWMMIDVFMAGNWMIRGSGTTIDIVDIPWLSEDPITGTVDAGGEQIVTVTFDSAGLSAGDYFANLVILSNDPDTPMYTLPVTMTVFAAAVDIDTLTPAQSGDPGVTVTYTLQVANLGDAEDTFDITASGLWTTTVLDPVVTLPPSGVADVMVEVEIPLDAMAGDSDMATITATSQGDPTVSDTVDLTTTANQVYGVELTPETDAMLGAPGERVEYTLTLMNTGNGPDTYEIAYSGNTWNVHLPVELVMVDAGDSVAVIVHVDIPAGAADGDFDVADITATSVGDDTVSASSELTTTAVVEVGEGYMIFLPTVFR
jgi:hypothetical protein